MEIKITFIAVTHDMASAYKISDRITMLHDAGIIDSGTPDEIKNSSLGIIQQFIGDRAEGHTTNF
jgi:phospholipid/cholesterol/gamma-HCH transport system ATP-binding protein